MASGADNVLILDMWENYTIPSTNQSSVHWRLRLQVNWGVNAIMVGQVGLTDANGSSVVVWSYTGNPGSLTNGNTYTLAEGDAVLSHDSSGGGIFSGWAFLRTNQQGSTWSFNKSTTASIRATPIVRVPSLPRNLRANVSRDWAQLVADEPTDWGNQRGTVLFRISQTNPPNTPGTYTDGYPCGTTALNCWNPYTFQGLTPNTTYYATAYAWNTAGYSDTPMTPPYVISFTTLSAVPAWPTDLVITSGGTAASPTHHMVWTNNATSDAPYERIEIRRQEWTGSTWTEQATIATLPGSTTSYDAPSAPVNRAYRYRVRAGNSGGTATSGAVDTAPTRPLQLTSVRAERGQGGSAVVSWAYPPQALTGMHSLRVVVDELVNGTWTMKASLPITTSSPITSWTDTAPSGGVTTYRVYLRAQVGWSAITGAGPYLWTSDGPYSTVNLTIEESPGPPSRLWPSSVPVDLARVQIFSWQYNSRDGSPQTYFQVRYRLVGATEWTTTEQTASADAAWLYPAGLLTNGLTYQWQVRTMGGCQTCGWSDWSATSTFTGSYTPVVTINYPVAGSVQSIARLTATWGYFDADGQPQIRWWATLYGSYPDEQLETLSGTGDTSEVTFSTLVEDGKDYTVVVLVEDSSGLRSDLAFSTFTVQYDPPGMVILDAVWDHDSATVGLSMTPTMSDGGEGGESSGSLAPDGAVVVDEVDLEDDGAVVVDADDIADDGAALLDLDDSVEEPIAVDVWRQIDDGPWVLLAEQVSPSSSLVDRYPTMLGCNRYRLVVWSALPSTRVQDPAATVCVGPNRRVAGEGGVVHTSPESILSYGPTPDDQLRLCGTTASEDIARDQDAVWVDGAQDPVWLGGTVIEETFDLDGSTTQGRPPVRAAVRTDAPLVWRDITGQRVQVSIQNGLSEKWLRQDHADKLEVKGTLLRIGSGDVI